MNEVAIIDALQKEDLFGEFCAQVKKDFESAGCEAGFVKQFQPDYPLVLEIMVGAMESLLDKHPDTLGALLYRVDVSEKSLNASVSKGGGSLPALVAELIVRREVQKVMLRKQFRK